MILSFSLLLSLWVLLIRTAHVAVGLPVTMEMRLKNQDHKHVGTFPFVVNETSRR